MNFFENILFEKLSSINPLPSICVITIDNQNLWLTYNCLHPTNMALDSKMQGGSNYLYKNQKYVLKVSYLYSIIFLYVKNLNT